MIMLPPHYRNYWLDLARKEYEDKQHQRRKAIQKIADMLKTVANRRLKKP